MKVLIVTGSSGGHIFPAVALMQQLEIQENRPQALLILPQRCRGKIILPENLPVIYLPLPKLTLAFNRAAVISFGDLFKSSSECLRILLKFRPDVVVGFGSFDSLPLVFFAWFLRIKTILHEQNVLPGRANKLLAKLVDKVAVSFNQTLKYLGVSPRKVIFTGNPLRRDLKPLARRAALEYFSFPENKFTILVAGGSQGSSRINIGFINSLSGIAAPGALQVIHLSGHAERAILEECYHKLGISARVFDFLEPMQYAYSCADLAVCRSGATTVAELILFTLPAILIPYPYAYAHQSANAQVLAEAGCAVIIKDEEAQGPLLGQTVADMIRQPQKASRMRLAYQAFRSDGASAVVKLASRVFSQD